MNGSVTVTGTVLEVAHRKGAFDNDRGENIVYDFHLASVLVGTKVLEVKFRPDNGDARPPEAGSYIAIEVELPKGAKPVAKRYVQAVSDGSRKAG